MRRREAIAVLGCVALGAPWAARGQPGRNPYRIGTLTAAWAANHPTVEGLRAGLAALGMNEGREVLFEHRYTEGYLERLPVAAASLVASGVDVLFTVAENATRAAANATATLPIVFANVGDPVASGLVRDLARPGGNVTGVSNLDIDLAPKRLEMLKALAPGLLPFEYGGTTLDIPAQMLETAARAKALTVFSSAFWVEYGALASYGSDHRALGVQAARLVAKILAGSRPRDLPVEGANRIELVINLKVAKAIGISIPPAALVRADRVIEAKD